MDNQEQWREQVEKLFADNNFSIKWDGNEARCAYCFNDGAEFRFVLPCDTPDNFYQSFLRYSNHFLSKYLSSVLDINAPNCETMCRELEKLC